MRSIEWMAAGLALRPMALLVLVPALVSGCLTAYLLDTVHQTLVLCEGEVATQEAGILAVIKNRPVYAIDTGSGQLRLTSDADQVLLFEP